MIALVEEKDFTHVEDHQGILKLIQLKKKTEHLNQ